MFEAVPVTRDETSAAGVDLEQRPECVILEIEKIVGIVEGSNSALQDERRDPRESVHRLQRGSVC